MELPNIEDSFTGSGVLDDGVVVLTVVEEAVVVDITEDILDELGSIIGISLCSKLRQVGRSSGRRFLECSNDSFSIRFMPLKRWRLLWQWRSQTPGFVAQILAITYPPGGTATVSLYTPFSKLISGIFL